ncbi:LCP family protein [Cellulomonas persica]|uniref:Transcriptional regulator n=1 Tax=Cellulomonas persica TaxID=76861 RepID=A0A510URB7_9CELL|nr:LCP family protein [Cellulomonas persica]GEK17149.1 transcriptional regulator [Cellulomonas persica]
MPGQQGPGRQGPGQAPPRRKRRRRLVLAVVALVLVLMLAWPIGLVMWANGKIEHVDALSGATGTPGTTYLITGSDSRADGGVKDDGTAGQRSDTILLLHVPSSGPTALISLPRDTYVEIPGKGPGKINAAYAYGGAPLLVETVEKLSGLTVDHYAEIGMAGVKQVVDAVGGVRLCYDRDVDDKDSKLKWKAGCHTADGTKALQFARMRKSDPLGDIGRAERQRQLVKAVLADVEPRELVLHPSRQVDLIDAATGTLTVDESADIIDLGRLALAFRAANSDAGITGTPPIASMDYRPGGVGSTVLLDPGAAPEFFRQIRDGELKPGKVGGV